MDLQKATCRQKDFDKGQSLEEMRDDMWVPVPGLWSMLWLRCEAVFLGHPTRAAQGLRDAEGEAREGKAWLEEEGAVSCPGQELSRPLLIRQLAGK